MKKLLVVMLSVLMLTGCGNQNPSNPSDNIPDDTNQNVERKAFKADEVKDFFTQTEKDIEKKLGKPSNVQNYEMYENQGGKDLIYDEHGSVSVWESQDSNGKVFKANLTSNEFSYPRGIKIGDSLEDVLVHFPDQNKPVTETDDQNLKYRLLYGEYVHMSSYGVVEYNRDAVPIGVVFSDEDYAFSVVINNNKVVAIKYSSTTD